MTPSNNKLSKEAEKRFDKWYLDNSIDGKIAVTPAQVLKELKQHLADELALQKEEIKSKLEEMKIKDTTAEDLRKGIYRRGDKEAMEATNETLDQAVTILEEL